MGHEKAIASGKEHRQPYRRSKAFDTSCRNHGSCPCYKGRLHNRRRGEMSADDQLREEGKQ
ncbi:MAG TPA: hypothetical protein ENH80_11745 [Phycisphaerae bacterium]|nr:hypothetical protein [Phycisphaerae bacterium]